MANSISKEILVKTYSLPVRIPYVQNSNAIDLIFTLKDYTIPSGSTARVYVKKVSGKAVYTTASVSTSANTVTVTVTTQMVAEAGEQIMNIEIISSSKVLISFPIILDVEESAVSDMAVVSKDEYDVLTAATKAAETATSKANTAASKADTATSKANTAASTANASAAKADTATTNANTATAAAETATETESANEAAAKAEVAESLINVDANGEYSVKEMEMIPYLAKAIQELSTQVSSLKNEIAELTGESMASVKKAPRKRWTPTSYSLDEKNAFIASTKPVEEEVEKVDIRWEE